MNAWVGIPHEFEPMPEPEFADLCRWCGQNKCSQLIRGVHGHWPLIRYPNNFPFRATHQQGGHQP